MHSRRKLIYAEDLLEIVYGFEKKLAEIEVNVGNEIIINQGLFLMAYSNFEDTIRKVIRLILLCFPEKLDIKSCSISKKQICEIAEIGHGVIIDNEIYQLFRNGVKDQITYVCKIISNKKERDFTNEFKKNLENCMQISLIRNALIHNAGKITNQMIPNNRFYNKVNLDNIYFYEEHIKSIFQEFKYLMTQLKKEILITYQQYNKLPRIERIRLAWDRCFKSPIMNFSDYWDIDYDNDVIRGIIYPKIERNISSSEEVLLSIWRHQYDSSISTKEFLLCSVHHGIISKTYQELYDIEFFYMKQRADNFK